MISPQNVAILGATGSIGTSTLDVIARHPDRFRAHAVTAHARSRELLAICERHRPAFAVLTGPVEDLAGFRSELRRVSPHTEFLRGDDALVTVAAAPGTDVVMAAIVGGAGLPSTLAAARAGKRVLLANKEALVMAGGLFMTAVREAGATLLPIDSEHNAIFQCLPTGFGCGPKNGALDAAGVLRILLTGSGGPFRTRPIEELESVTPDEACAHPTWNMGRKISIDSATMMNKALEIIEAHWLFNAPAERIQVVVHPQSVIHSMVEYADGSVLAQLGNPDMRTPIAQALAWPERVAAGVGTLDLAAIGKLSFERPDPVRFPALRLAYEVLAAGGSTPAVFNAANEVAVAAFLAGRTSFPSITRIIERTLEAVPGPAADSLDDVTAVDQRARACAERLVSQDAA